MKVTSHFILSAALLLVFVPVESQGVTRDQVIINAQSFATHVWSSTAANDTASCAPAYSSQFLDIYGVGGPHVGLPYKWGGFDSIASFDSEIAQGFGAGSHSSDGVLSCVTGLDCSGFVSRAWELASKMGTWTIHEVSHEIGAASLLPGDALNKSSTHIYLFHKLAVDGAPDVYEAAGGVARKVRYNTGLTWAKLQGYKPIRYNGIGDGGAAPAVGQGTTILVDSFPFHHDFSTAGQPPWGFNSYGCSPSTGEWGPEVVYELHLDQPGQLSAQVSDGVGVDIDLHILSDLDPAACLDRGDVQVGPLTVGAGVVYLVADSWSNSAGISYPGAYSLDISFVPASNAAPGANIIVDSFPFSHTHTTVGGSSQFDSYSCAPGTGEAGPEVVYELHLNAPGALSAQVSDGAGVDIDLHILSALTPTACLDRDDVAVGPVNVGSGVIYLVADSWSNGSGAAYPGAYQLQIQFQSDGVPDLDGDGVEDALDACPSDGSKSAPGMCGCGQADIDTDADGSFDCVDACPTDQAKLAPGICGCGALDMDSDGDGAMNCEETCPQDGAKLQPGVCGCGSMDLDVDGDGSMDCQDLCMADPAKNHPGACGCGLSDADVDGDGFADCVDGCPQDPLKQVPGTCGCGLVELDSDGDGLTDCGGAAPQVDPAGSAQPEPAAPGSQEGLVVEFQESPSAVTRPPSHETSGCAASSGGAPVPVMALICLLSLFRRPRRTTCELGRP